MAKKRGINFKYTLLLLIIFCLSVIIFAAYIQLKNQSKLEKCSYLDPVSIDALAFIAAVFLIVEGIYKIYKNKNIKPSFQLTRIIRICLGFSILTLHIIQVLHK